MAIRKMVRVSSKGQIVLPKRIREKLEIHEGDYLFVEESKDGISILRHQPETRLEALTKELRDEVEAEGFTREDLDELIHAIRERRSAA